MTEEKVRVFISYSHRDEALRQQLDKHLAPLKRQGVIEAWHDRQIKAGMEWANQIDESLRQADIILLLVSPDFVASDYCSAIELVQAMARHDSGEAIVVPIILEPCDWSWLPFAKVQAFPKDAKAITTWTNLNEAFLDVATGIRKVAQELSEKRKLLAEQQREKNARYLQKVREVLSNDGKISTVERVALDDLQEELGLTKQEAKEIEDDANKPYSRYQEKLNKYKQTLNMLIEEGEFPFNEDIQKDLENLQRDLGLKSEDVARISEPIFEAARSQPREKVVKAPAPSPVAEIPVPTKSKTKVETKMAPAETETEVETEAEFEYFAETLPGDVVLELAPIPSGSFRMGSKAYAESQPIHKVTLEPFFISKYPITQAQWEAVMGTYPSHFQGDDLPVESVTWHDAKEFCDALSELTGNEYRLPSEAEWEYAARAGATGDFCFNNDEGVLDDYAWYDQNSNGGTNPVGQKNPNAWGLYDVHGNVGEWCEDVWHESYKGAPTDGSAWVMDGDDEVRVFRGGSWGSDQEKLEFGCRGWADSDVSDGFLGFRVVCVAASPSEQRFAAIWEQTDGPSWQARHGLSSSEFQQTFDELISQGYRLVQVSGYSVDGEDRFAAIWEKREGPAFQAGHGLNSSEYQQTFDELLGQGYRLVQVSGYSVDGEERFAAIWEEREGPAFQACHGLNSSEYQQTFDELIGQGYRLVQVSGYSVDGEERFAAIWEQKKGPSWEARHGLESAEYQQTCDELLRQGFRLIQLSVYSITV